MKPEKNIKEDQASKKVTFVKSNQSMGEKHGSFAGKERPWEKKPKTNTGTRRSSGVIGGVVGL